MLPAVDCCACGLPSHTPLHHLPQGADVHSMDVECKTALHFACAGGHVPAARVLINFGADAVARDLDGQVKERDSN
jgi:ankyrin repeat protein